MIAKSATRQVSAIHLSELKLCIGSLIARIVLTGMMLLGAGIASSQTASTSSGQAFPSKPIRIVTAEAGGGNDFAARLIAQGLIAGLGQQVIVENRGGVNAFAVQTVSRALPDGYTLLLYSGSLWIAPFLKNMPSFNPEKDFAPITMATAAPFFLYVHPALPAKSIKELVAVAKSKPGELNYGSAGTGAPTHLAAELFKSMAAVNIVRVAYKGAGPAINAVISGEIQMMFGTASLGLSHARSGRLRALAVTSPQPSALAPDLPTVSASGLPGYSAESLAGVFAPVGTPRALVSRLHQEIARALNRADVKEKFLSAGLEPVGNAPEQFVSMLKSDMAKWSKLIKDAGIREE